MHALELIDSSPQADLIVLPEMFTTGFCMSASECAESANNETLAWMQEVAHNKNTALAGSIATKENGLYYNRFYFVKPDRSYAIYDKRHLFTFGGENNAYTSGTNRVIVEHMGVRILLQICYDLRFPVFARNRGDYDAIIYVANWPIPRIEVWNILLKARAIENVSYVLGVNRVGNDPYCQYNGGTVLLNYMGKGISKSTSDMEEIVYGKIDLQQLYDFRKKFPVLDDADLFSVYSD
jgi:predicted amidohydrolase